jgi:hypothetical protein
MKMKKKKKSSLEERVIPLKRSGACGGNASEKVLKKRLNGGKKTPGSSGVSFLFLFNFWF